MGTENGSIGLLDIPSHKYATLLRSHVGRVNAVALDPNRPQYCTVSSDGTFARMRAIGGREKGVCSGLCSGVSGAELPLLHSAGF